MNKFLTFLLVFISISVFGQTKYEIGEFSEKYKGVLTISSGYENDVLKKGIISIIEIKTNDTIITINSENLSFELNNNREIETNILELPYGNQSLLICEDFNFDGKNDLAIMDGQQSCYGGPSFKVYLEHDNKLKYSSKFTKLAQEYCGMFEVDYKTKTIKTMTKSGCCWHQFSEFKVINNEPIAIKILEESFHPNGFILNYSEKNRVNGKMVETKYSILPESGIDIITIYKFKVRNEKTVHLFHSFDEVLYYTFTNNKGVIELFYSDEFVFDKNNQTLSFVNQEAKYEISKKGVFITTPKKKASIDAIISSLEGDISDLSNLNFENMNTK